MIQSKHLISSCRRVGLPLLTAVTLLCGIAYLPSAFADTEITKINENYNGSRFAQSVALSNDIAVIGTSEENNGFASTGAAYIYRNNQGNWQREARLVLDNRGSFDRFGWSVAASGNVAVIGSNGSGQQVAQIYQFDGSQWNETTRLTPPRDGVSGFGRNVAVSGDVTIIGARYSTNDGVSAAGAAFIYRFDGTTWIEEADLSLDVSRGAAQFGSGVAIHNDLAVVGAPAPYSSAPQGSAHVYRFNGTSWIKEAELSPNDDSTDDQFGTRVAVFDNAIVVGSPFDDSNGEDAGSAYVFRFDGTTWSQDARLIPSDGGSFEYFGSDVALSDGVAVIGAPGDDDNGRDSGSAYEFRYDSTSWSQASKLTASDASEIARLGGSVSISEDVVLIGASGDSENGIISGAAYTFDIALDTDSDGLPDPQDNCPSDWNPLQENFDDDLLGDACDLDDDNDGLDDDQDPAPYDPSVSSAPTPASPSGNNIPPGVNFEWAAMPGATRYVIEIQHNGQVRAYESMIMASVACSDARCRYVKPDAALEGTNRWRLRAGTNSVMSDWSPWTDFIVDNNAPPIVDEVEPDDMQGSGTLALPQPTSPTGSISNLGVDYRWPQVPGATHYSIEIQHNGSIRGYASMLNTELHCADGNCVYTKTDAALLGNNRWRVKAGNASGSTAWSTWTEFTVAQTNSGTSIPVVPALGTPNGSVANPNSEYQWSAVMGATRYAIEVQHNGLIRTYDDTINASTTCSAVNCRYIKPDAALAGENRWRLRAGSTAGFSQWSDWRYFVVE